MYMLIRKVWCDSSVPSLAGRHVALGEPAERADDDIMSEPPTAAASSSEEVPPAPTDAPAALTESLTSILATEGARQDVVDGIEGVGTLSRRIGAQMLRRAAERATAAAALPDAARDALVSGNTALADAIAPAEDAPAA